MNFFDKAGKMAIGSRLRIISERMIEDAAALYQMYEVPIHPKWFPVFYVLSEGNKLAITDIARNIGHSHPSVSKIVAEMAKAGIITESKDTNDKRRNLIGLSKKGMAIISKIKPQYTDVNDAIEEALSQTQNDIWKAIDELEFLLNEKSLFQRVIEKKKARERKGVQIVEYQPKYKKAFKVLNEEWIDTYFKLEEEDRKLLDDPKTNILDKGGHIFMAVLDKEVIGTCVMIPMEDFPKVFELGKMAVSPKARGKGVGELLGLKIIQKGKGLGAKSIYLESNTVLKPAINLYNKLGFKKVNKRQSPYARCNIQMELNLD